MLKITVIVPTYQRPQDLARCLAALKLQIRPVDELWVIVRDTDQVTWQFLNENGYDAQSVSQASLTSDRGDLPLHIATVTAVGVIAAMNIGLEASTGDIVAFTDDDAAPHPDWLAKIEAYYLADKDKKIGGVGGRDWMYHGPKLVEGSSSVVGKLAWFGRLAGNHHLGIGGGREVDVLKGVNMSFRREAIADLRFDQKMRGSGAQVHFEMVFCFALKQRGWQLIYDPQIAVDHFLGQRFDEDQRNTFNAQAAMNITHNETVAMLGYLAPFRRFVFLVWAIAIGTRESRGLLQLFRFLPQEGALSAKKLWAAWRGRWQGWQTWQKSC